MKAEKNTFVMSYDWADIIQECTTEEKAWLLDAVYEYQLRGTIPETDNRFLKTTFLTMRKFFDINAEKYEEKKIVNSLNQQKRWFREKNDIAGQKLVDEKLNYIKSHSLKEYRDVYERIRTYTDNDTDIDTDIDSDTDSDTDTEYDSDTDIETDIENEYVSGDVEEGEIVSLEDLQAFHDANGYTFNCQTVYSAKTKPLYRKELKSMCDFWESMNKH